MQKNRVRNANIDYIVKRVFVPASAFIQSQVTGASTILNAGFGTGDAEYWELGTSGIGAIRLEATTDDVNYLWVPSDFDNRHPLHIRYLWTSDYNVGGGTATFTTLYKDYSVGDVPAAPAVALTKVHAAGTKTFSNQRAIYWSPYGSISKIATGVNAQQTFGQGAIIVLFNTKVSAVTGITIASDFVYLLGMELVYTPRLTFGSSERPARMLRDGLQSNLELDVANDI